MSESQEYTLRWRGRQLGPYSIQEINRKLDEHEIGLGHEIHHQGKWISLEEFFAASKQTAVAGSKTVQRATLPQLGTEALPNLAQSAGVSPSEVAPAPLAGRTSAATVHPSNPMNAAIFPRSEASPQPVASESRPAPATRPRQRLVYALLGVFLGFLGLHNYYARHWLTGLLQLLLSIATYLLGFGIIAPWLWALVEAVIVRKDGNGMDMI